MYTYATSNIDVILNTVVWQFQINNIKKVINYHLFSGAHYIYSMTQTPGSNFLCTI